MLKDTDFAKLIPSTTKKDTFKVSKVKIVKESKIENEPVILNEASIDQYRKAFVRGIINAPEYLLQAITPVLQDIESYVNSARIEILPETMQAIEAVKSAMDVAAVAVEAETKERKRTIDYDDQLMSAGFRESKKQSTTFLKENNMPLDDSQFDAALNDGNDKQVDIQSVISDIERWADGSEIKSITCKGFNGNINVTLADGRWNSWRQDGHTTHEEHNQAMAEIEAAFPGVRTSLWTA